MLRMCMLQVSFSYVWLFFCSFMRAWRSIMNVNTLSNVSCTLEIHKRQQLQAWRRQGEDKTLPLIRPSSDTVVNET